MTGIMEIFGRERARMERELEMVKDLKAAVDCVCTSLERMRLEYCGQIKNRKRWNEADRLFDISRQSVRCMLSATGAGISVVRDEQAVVTIQDRLIAMMPMAAMVIGAVLSVWLMLEEMNGAAVLAAMLTAIAWLETQVIYRRRLAVAAFSKVDKHELLKLIDRLMESMDYALEMSAQEAEAVQNRLDSGDQPALTGAMLAPVQMLYEAVRTGDGDYALKALPAMAAALAAQGIEIVEYSSENEEYFDMYPGTEQGITIRPALIREGKVIARGQATEEMK